MISCVYSGLNTTYVAGQQDKPCWWGWHGKFAVRKRRKLWGQRWFVLFGWDECDKRMFEGLEALVWNLKEIILQSHIFIEDMGCLSCRLVVSSMISLLFFFVFFFFFVVVLCACTCVCVCAEREREGAKEIILQSHIFIEDMRASNCRLVVSFLWFVSCWFLLLLCCVVLFARV